MSEHSTGMLPVLDFMDKALAAAQEVVVERDQLRAQLEQERDKNAALEKERAQTKLGAVASLSSGELPEWAIKLTERYNIQAVAERDSAKHEARELTAERDSLRATLAALQQRCAKLETAGSSLVASIDSIRTMLYGLSLDLRQAAIAQRAIDEAIDAKRLWNDRAALAPDAGSGVSKEGYEGLGFGPKIEGHIKKP